MVLIRRNLLRRILCDSEELQEITTGKENLMNRLLATAGTLLFIHGLMEIAGLLSLLLPGSQPPPFIFQEIKQNWQMVTWIGAISGLLRILASIGIFANRKWGWVLGVLISLITFAMLTFYLPFGILDALFAAIVLATLIIFNYSEIKIVG